MSESSSENSRDNEETPEEAHVAEPEPIKLDEADCPIQAPAWMATFSDLGTLLMAFLSLSSLSP